MNQSNHETAKLINDAKPEAIAAIKAIAKYIYKNVAINYTQSILVDVKLMELNVQLHYVAFLGPHVIYFQKFCINS
jgi:hypothetical protein